MRVLLNRTALVTGASRGIGIHLVRALAEENMNVVLSGVSQSELSQAEETFAKSGARVISVPADLEDRAAVEVANRNGNERVWRHRRPRE